MISPKKTWILLPRIQWPKVFKLVPPTQNIFLSSEIKPVVVRSCSIRQKELDLVILNSQRGNFLPMNCYSFGKHSAPIALRWGWKNTKAFTIGWSHFRSSILTLDSGIDVPPGINFIKKFSHHNFNSFLHQSWHCGHFSTKNISSKFFQKIINVPLCLFRTLE